MEKTEKRRWTLGFIILVISAWIIPLGYLGEKILSGTKHLTIDNAVMVTTMFTTATLLWSYIEKRRVT